MCKRVAARNVLGLAVGILFAVVSTGAPFARVADHNGDPLHVDTNHGGHGHVLAQQDERIQSQYEDLVLQLPVAAVDWEPPALGACWPTVNRLISHLGRDPPARIRTRAPPFLTL